MHESSVARCCHEAKAFLLIVFVLRALSFQLSLSRSESSPVYLSCVRYPFDYLFCEVKVHLCICLACAIRTCVRHSSAKALNQLIQRFRPVRWGASINPSSNQQTELNIASLNKLNICSKLEWSITIPFLESNPNSEMHRSHNLT